MFETPKITILEYELIINNKLYETGAISKEQYDLACKIIYEKISHYKKANYWR